MPEIRRRPGEQQGLGASQLGGEPFSWGGPRGAQNGARASTGDALASPLARNKHAPRRPGLSGRGLCAPLVLSCCVPVEQRSCAARCLLVSINGLFAREVSGLQKIEQTVEFPRNPPPAQFPLSLPSSIGVLHWLHLMDYDCVTTQGSLTYMGARFPLGVLWLRQMHRVRWPPFQCPAAGWHCLTVPGVPPPPALSPSP